MKANVSIVTSPLPRASQAPLSNLVKLFSIVAYRVYVVSGGAAEDFKFDANVEPIIVPYKVSSNILLKIINYMHTQLKILFHVLVISRKANLFIFFLGGEYLFVPMLALKLRRKKVLLMLTGVATRVFSIKKDPLCKFASVLVSINLSLADRLIVYSRRLIQEANLAKYQHKIIIAHEHFVDFTRLIVNKKIDEKPHIVGYVGRLSEVKGILNLIEAVPLVLKKRADTRFMILGDGSLADKIKRTIKANGLEMHVKLTRWIAHEDVPQYLNELKMLVLPSFTEGLPNVILEAMACGTPVLATPVGAIPDIIKDGETGFLLKSSDPKHIADKIIELLGKPELLEKVSINVCRYVRENFSYQKTLQAWLKIFEQLEITN